MVRPVTALALLGLALAWSVFCNAGADGVEWCVTPLILGCVSTGYWLFAQKMHHAPPLAGWLRCLILLFPLYLAFQLIPLPLRVLQIFSPSRASLLRALQPLVAGISSAPLSVNPPASVLRLFLILGCIAIFLLVRELTWRFSASPWTAAMPLLVIGTFEAGLGMFQVFVGWPNATAIGTYTSRDHFAGLLEMLLPFATLHGVAILRRNAHAPGSTVSSALKACALWACAATMLLAIMYSLSRMGFLVALSVLFVSGGLAIAPRLHSKAWRWSSLAVTAAAILLICIFFPPTELVRRFADVSSTDKISADTRLSLWKETLPVIAEYRLFGCGLGGFESVFLKYQAVAANYRVEFAHNDYLQYLAELGILGFSMLSAILGGILFHICRALFSTVDENRRLLGIACTAAFIAVLLHSLVDFNMYVPANAMALAWIAGIGSANARS